MCLSVSTRSTLKIKCIDKDQENSPPGTFCLTYELASVLKFWLRLKSRLLSPNLMTLGTLVKA